MKVIIFPQDNGQAAVMTPVGDPMITAIKDVPTGVPFIIVEHIELPDAPQEAWVVNFSQPDGFGGQYE